MIALAQAPDQCLPTPRIVEIRKADPAVDRANHDRMRDAFIRAVGQANTTVLLGPDVVLDFSGIPDDALPIAIGRCVTVTSVTGFGPSPGDIVIRPDVVVMTRGDQPTATGRGTFTTRGGTFTTGGGTMTAGGRAGRDGIVIDGRGRAGVFDPPPPPGVVNVPRPVAVG